MKNKELYICRICGFENEYPLWLETGGPSSDICLCCGGESGYNDFQYSAIISNRQKWIDSGKKWFISEKKPNDWDFERQMKNIKNNIPTLLELKNKVEQDNIAYDDVYILDEKLANVVLSLLKDNIDFFNYLKSMKFSHFELPTTVLSYIQNYVLNEIDNNETKYIKILFNNLEELLKSGDMEVINLIQIGFLEEVNKENFSKMKPYMEDVLIQEYYNLIINID